MALTPGSRLGPYEVTALLREGGMGQVYRATDTNLKRQVALKVLPASVAADAERLARFQREAELLAALNHPHIAQIYGLEKSAELTALVMELVEGDDLSQRIARGAIPIDEALPIAKQIAEALEAAHERGIIRSLGFFADTKLKRIDLGGGLTQSLADVTATASAQGTWSAEGTILFTPNNATGSLLRLPAAGGPPTAATTLATGETGHNAPRFLPGGNQFLFQAVGAEPALWLGSLTAGTAPHRVTTLAPGESPGDYLAPATGSTEASREGGWLVRVRGTVLVAQRFVASTGQLVGDPIPLAQGVGIDPNSGVGAFSVAASGILGWRSGTGSRRQLIWFSRTGQQVGAVGAPDASNLLFPDISPDGTRTAFSRGPVGARDLWVQDSARTSRFTFDPADDLYPVWSPDGTRVVFTSNRTGAYDLYQKPANGSGSEALLLHSADNIKRPTAWSPDGRFILYNSNQNNGDLMVLPLTGTANRQPSPFLSTPFAEMQGVFSPDGTWVAYQSNESGRNEIYVRPFPGPGGQWQISTGGGTSPRWRGDGKELYYLAPDNKIMAVPVAVQRTGQAGTFVPSTPAALFQTHSVSGPRANDDVTRDGRFLINTALDDTSTERIHLLLNWKPPSK